MYLLLERDPSLLFLLVTIPYQERLVRKMVAGWHRKPEIIVRKEEKWQAFADADATMAVSGTVVLELAFCNIPMISIYKADWIATLLSRFIKTWTCALPNLIVDYPAVPEYFNEAIRHGALARWIEKLTCDTLQRQAMLDSFRILQDRMRTTIPAGEASATIILDILQYKKNT